MSFARFDVIIVPFPFTDLPVVRRRPALVVSDGGWNRAADHVVAAMITSAGQSDWPLDVAVSDLGAAGLTVPCRVRMKLFTLEASLVLGRRGGLAATDARNVEAALSQLLRIAANRGELPS